MNITLGKTGLTVPASGFGALPIQRIAMNEAVKLLRKALAGGITFFDTARYYTDSEEKLGAAFSGCRDKIILASKTGAVTAEGFWKDLETTLRNLRTDHLDLYQFHNPDFCPEPGGGDGLYDAMLEAKKQGKVRFIGITNHRRAVARKAVDSGLYDTLQFPLSYLSDDGDRELARYAILHNMGFLAMKALAGGLIRNARAAAAWLRDFGNVLPLWGIQKESELDEFLAMQNDPPVLDEAAEKIIAADRKELSGEFCRGCGYCLPCPAGIEINNCARMSLLLRRAPLSVHLSEPWREKMAKVPGCLHCNRCKSRCPYHLDTPELLRRNYEDYLTFLHQDSNQPGFPLKRENNLEK